jgi:glycosyltransferase involved in cell wall biosynthesis
VSRIKISDRLKKWLEKYEPEVLYLQISNRESILYSLELIEYLKIPAAIHMMDDWPMTVSSRGPFRKYWHNRIDREFRELLAKTTSYLSISDAMSEEYLNRYGKQFKAFHNPVDPSWFNEDPVTNESDKRYFRVLYLGRIGIANEYSLLAFSEFISNYIYQDCIVEFDVYTKDIDSKIARRIGNLKGVRINLPVNHEDVPSLMTRYQLLLLPLDFTRSGLKFSRLSMPSKTSEYMLSGTPIMVMAPAESAVSKFCTYNKCAHCISSDKLEDLTKTMNFLIENDDYRKDLASGAKRLANQLFNRRKVTRDFRDFLVTLSSFK